MDLDDTDDAKLGARIADIGAGEHGFVTRQRVARVANKLFGAISAPQVPVKIGRFTVVRELGAGGMGVVYVAYDEQLDRRVAVKLMRDAKASFEARARFEREAQAMARLTHPNVVTVHEVGTFEGQLFVAMEFVDGQDLRGWIGEHDPSWAELLALFLAAGEGLAAAHEAGIVHRDFKPDNVLVGEDGRVCVADFGLAAALVAEDLDEDDDLDGDTKTDSGQLSSSSNRLSSSLTRTGSVMGTPAYMAPEQYRGLQTDARTDQFSFCVALWEGLYRKRPFTGHNLVALSAAVASGELEPPPREREVPPWVHAALVRGLSPKPDDRWPTMEALLAALANDPRARRRRIFNRVALGLVTLGILGASTWLAATELAHNAHQRYWNAVTEELLALERDRGLAQAQDDAIQASDATHMSVMRDYKAQAGVDRHEDPTIAAALLREVKGDTRLGSAWISAANEVLGESISRAVWTEHRDAIGPMVFAPDGEWLYAASDDGEVRRWRVADDHSEVIIEHGQQVNALVLSPDGRWLASGANDGTARIWNPRSPDTDARVVGRHDEAVKQVAFDPQGQWLASAAADGSVKLHNLDGGPDVEFDRVDAAVLALAFDSSGELLVTGSRDHHARVWHVESGRLLATLIGHGEPIYHVAVLADGRVLTAADDGGVRLWQRPEPSAGPMTIEVSTLVTEHPGAVAAIDVHGSKLVSACTEGRVRVSELSPPHATVELPAYAGPVFSARFTPDGEGIISASLDGTSARLSPVDGRGPSTSFVGHREAVYSTAVSADGRWLATGSYDTSIRLWALDRPRLSVALPSHANTVFSLAASSDGQRFVSASNDESARVWSAEGERLATLEPKGKVIRAAFSPDGEHIGLAATLSLTLWTREGALEFDLVGHERAVWSLAFDPSGERLASASYDRSARVWDTHTGAELLVLRGHEGQLVGVEFDPSGERLLTAARDGTVRVWDVTTGTELAVLRGHEGEITSFARSRDGKTLATGSDDGSARLWTGDNFSEVTVLEGHEHSIWSLAFDAEDTRLLTATVGGEARVWRMADGHLLASSSGHAGRIHAATFAADGRAITAGADETVRVWPLDGRGVPLVLSGHGAQVTSLVVLPDGVHLVSGGGDGSLRRWNLDLLDTNPDALHERLRSATRYCLSATQRVEELGQDPVAAALAVERCREGP